jgi:hypothetical protein
VVGLAFRPESQSSGMIAGTSPWTRTGCANDTMPPPFRIHSTPLENRGSLTMLLAPTVTRCFKISWLTETPFRQ